MISVPRKQRQISKSMVISNHAHHCFASCAPFRSRTIDKVCAYTYVIYQRSHILFMTLDHFFSILFLYCKQSHMHTTYTHAHTFLSFLKSHLTQLTLSLNSMQPALSLSPSPSLCSRCALFTPLPHNANLVHTQRAQNHHPNQHQHAQKSQS